VLLSAIELNINMMWKLTEINKVSPRARRDDMPPADGSSTVAYRFAANQAISRAYLQVHENCGSIRPSADGSAVRTSLLAGDG